MLFRLQKRQLQNFLILQLPFCLCYDTGCKSKFMQVTLCFLE